MFCEEMSRLCLGIINPIAGGGKVIVFFVVLFFCSTCVFLHLIGILIKVWSLRVDCKHGLRISSRLCKRVWIQWEELHDMSIIQVVVWFILYLTNSGLNLPAGVWTLLSSCIQLPNFMTLIQLQVLLAAFLTTHSGAIKTVPQESPIYPLTEHVLIYFQLKIRMCSIAVIDGEGICMVHCNSYECLCGLSGSQRSERSHISIYFSFLLAQRVELSFCTSDVGEFICYLAQTWCLHST